MTKETIIQHIIKEIKANPDDIIDGNFYCDIYNKDGEAIYYDGNELTLLVIENDELIFEGENHVSYNPNNLTEEILEEIYGGLVCGHNTFYKNEYVKQRTIEVADKMKKRLDELVNKAFNTGAFDLDDAFRNGYVIPKAIVAAAAKTIMDECTCGDFEIRNEIDNIYQFL